LRKIAHVLFLLLFCLAFFMPNCALGAEGGAASQIVDSSAPVLDITLYASSTSVPADNTTVSYIVAEVRDGAGNLVPGSEVTFQVAQGPGVLSATTVQTDSSQDPNKRGRAVVAIKSAQPGDTAVLCFNDLSDSSLFITFTPFYNISVSYPPMQTLGHNIAMESQRLTVVIKDAAGDPVAGVPVTFTTDLGAFNEVPAAELGGNVEGFVGGSGAGGTGSGMSGEVFDMSIKSLTITTAKTGTITGEAVVDLISNTTGTANVTLAVGEQNRTLTVTFPPMYSLVLSASPAAVPADDMKVATIEAIVITNKIPGGIAVIFTTDRGSLSAESAITNNTGNAFTTIRSSQAGVATVTATIGSANTIKNMVTVTFKPPYSLSLSSSPPTTQEDNTGSSDITAVVRDASGNPVSGATVTFAADNGTLSANACPTDAKGQATVNLSRITAKSVTVTGRFNDLSSTTVVSFSPGNSNSNNAQNNNAKNNSKNYASQFTGTYDVSVNTSSTNAYMPGAAAKNSQFSAKVGVIDQGDSMVLDTYYKSIPINLVAKVTGRTQDSAKCTLSFNLANKTVSGEAILTFTRSGDTFSLSGMGEGAYVRPYTPEKGADYHPGSGTVTGTRLSTALPNNVDTSQGGVGNVGDIPGPDNETQAVTGVLGPGLVALGAGLAGGLGGGGGGPDFPYPSEPDVVPPDGGDGGGGDGGDGGGDGGDGGDGGGDGGGEGVGTYPDVTTMVPPVDWSTQPPPPPVPPDSGVPPSPETPTTAAGPPVEPPVQPTPKDGDILKMHSNSDDKDYEYYYDADQGKYINVQTGNEYNPEYFKDVDQQGLMNKQAQADYQDYLNQTAADTQKDLAYLHQVEQSGKDMKAQLDHLDKLSDDTYGLNTSDDEKQKIRDNLMQQESNLVDGGSLDADKMNAITRFMKDTYAGKTADESTLPAAYDGMSVSNWMTQGAIDTTVDIAQSGIDAAHAVLTGTNKDGSISVLGIIGRVGIDVATGGQAEWLMTPAGAVWSMKEDIDKAKPGQDASDYWVAGKQILMVGLGEGIGKVLGYAGGKAADVFAESFPAATESITTLAGKASNFASSTVKSTQEFLGQDVGEVFGATSKAGAGDASGVLGHVEPPGTSPLSPHDLEIKQNDADYTDLMNKKQETLDNLSSKVNDGTVTQSDVRDVMRNETASRDLKLDTNDPAVQSKFVEIQQETIYKPTNQETSTELSGLYGKDITVESVRTPKAQLGEAAGALDHEQVVSKIGADNDVHAYYTEVGPDGQLVKTELPPEQWEHVYNKNFAKNTEMLNPDGTFNSAGAGKEVPDGNWTGSQDEQMKAWAAAHKQEVGDVYSAESGRDFSTMSTSMAGGDKVAATGVSAAGLAKGGQGTLIDAGGLSYMEKYKFNNTWSQGGVANQTEAMEQLSKFGKQVDELTTGYQAQG
jgi:hypothetical protein